MLRLNQKDNNLWWTKVNNTVKGKSKGTTHLDFRKQSMEVGGWVGSGGTLSSQTWVWFNWRRKTWLIEVYPEGASFRAVWGKWPSNWPSGEMAPLHSGSCGWLEVSECCSTSERQLFPLTRCQGATRRFRGRVAAGLEIGKALRYKSCLGTFGKHLETGQVGQGQGNHNAQLLTDCF